MPATVAAAMPDAAYIKACKWLTEPECEVYGQEYMRSGWTGALQEYRRRRNNGSRPTVAEQLTYSGRTIDVPSQAIVGLQDWGANRTVGGPMNIGKTGLHAIQRGPHGRQSRALGPRGAAGTGERAFDRIPSRARLSESKEVRSDRDVDG